MASVWRRCRRSKVPSTMEISDLPWHIQSYCAGPSIRIPDGKGSGGWFRVVRAALG